ncbi:hypothetical protein [Enterococcus sp. N249-2]
MEYLIINTSARQPDDKYKITYTATTPDGTHIDGSILVTEIEFMDMTAKNMKEEVSKRLVENFSIKK